MKTRHIAAVSLMLLILAFVAHSVASNYGFSPWMKRHLCKAWMAEHLDGKPVYLSAIEGRLHNGIEEFRFKLADAPEALEWYWYWAMDYQASEYHKFVVRMTEKDTFEHIWAQYFVDIEGNRNFQGVFLKIVRPK